jgi:hypothetical protein
MGFYRVHTEYDEHSGHPFDQKIVITRILQQDQVYLDPSAQVRREDDTRQPTIRRAKASTTNAV